eukprot:2327644-Amphidinium_carterae.1
MQGLRPSEPKRASQGIEHKEILPEAETQNDPQEPFQTTAFEEKYFTPLFLLPYMPGSVRCWGSNLYGQLGLENYDNSSIGQHMTPRLQKFLFLCSLRQRRKYCAPIPFETHKEFSNK